MFTLQISTGNAVDLAYITTLAKIAANVDGKADVNLPDVPMAVNRLIFATRLLIENAKGDFGERKEWELLVIRLKRLAEEIETKMIQPDKTAKNTRGL